MKHPESLISGLLLAAIAMLIFFEVFTRFLFGRTPSGMEEIETLFFIWFVFLGSVTAVRKKGHVSISFFVTRLNPFLRQLVTVVADVLVIIFLIVFAIYGILYTRHEMLSLSAILEIPEGYFALCIPLSAVLMAIYSFLIFKENLKKLYRIRKENI
jgi:TRAP-type C4-dicarboxylate transport system permease small subunit